MRPPPKQTVSEWADAERRLSPESSAEPGRWHTSRAEYQRGFMDAVSDPAVRKVVGVWAAQTGKTDCLLNVIGFHIHHDPAPILVIQPTLEMGEAWSKDRLAPMLRDSPSLRGRVSNARARDASNTIRHKVFPGGHLTVAGANSAASLSMRPIRILICDEIDRYPASAGTEGDPLELAGMRTVNFWNAKRLEITSPGTRGMSRIEESWDESDQRLWEVPCPDCGTFQILRWEQVQWEKDEEGSHLPETARYVCEKCGTCWQDVQRWAAVRRGRWRATKPLRGVAGFRLNALAAPWEQRKLERLVDQWLKAQGNPERLKVFVNTVLAEWWEDPDTAEAATDENVLMRRRKDFELPEGTEVPAPVALLTIGVDTQIDRLEYEIVGWGREEESWSVRYGRIYGDPKRDPGVLEELEALLLKPLVHAKGMELFIRAACFDTGGHASHVVASFCKPRLRRPLPNGQSQFVFGFKGAGGEGRRIWPEKATKSRKLGLRNLWVCGVDSAKDQVYGRLAIAQPGPGYCHWPMERTLSYFEQLTSEHVVKKWRAGRPYRAWELKAKGRPNEGLDCRVMAYAACVGLQSDPFLLDLDYEVRAIEALAAGGASQARAERQTPGRSQRRRGARSKGWQA